MSRTIAMMLFCACLCGAASANAVEIAKLRNDLFMGLKQVYMTQMNIDFNTRRSFSSGIQKTRQYHDGSKSYDIESFSGTRMMGMHNHHDHEYTIGLGELHGVLSGTTFGTRHLDFQIRMPHRKSSDFAATEQIPFPTVPKAVLDKKTIEEQTEEMRLWFKAFKDEDFKTRDYRKHFTSLLCYLEGAYTVPNDKDGHITELFTSDRHSIAANSWEELHDKVFFNTYSGHKNNGENYAILPTKIVGFNNTTPIVAQWNYRILCHPTKKFLYKNRLRPVDDFHLRFSNDLRLEGEDLNGRKRFEINHKDSDEWVDGIYTYGYLDKLMGEIPGMDNHQNKLKDNAYNVSALDIFNSKPLDAGYFHNMYATAEKGANGELIKYKAFNDKNVYMAMNTQKNVVPFSVEDGCKTKDGKKTCTYKGEQRWSYAVPLEVVYLTPLHAWNPHNIINRGDSKSTEGQKVRANGRNGGSLKSKAFDGSNSMTYFLTPSEFYSSGELKYTSADTVKSTAVGVLDPNGDVQMLAASGIQLVTRSIPGVGPIRCRFPIMPLADRGQTVFKEVDALRDYVLHPANYRRISNESETYNNDVKKQRLDPFSAGAFQMQYSVGSDIRHSHSVTITKYDVEIMQADASNSITVTSSKTADHVHSLKIHGKKGKGLFVVECDGKPTCENHGDELIRS